MRWEDGDNVTRGIPSRVVQYEGWFVSFLLRSCESILSII